MKLLERIGFKDDDFLTIFDKEEETKNQISQVADVFTGLILPKNYVEKKEEKANNAVGELFLMAREGKINPEFALSLIKGKNPNDYYFGKYPPGSVLKMNSREACIVTRPGMYNKNNGDWISCPVVRTFLQKNGMYRISEEKMIENPMEINRIVNPSRFEGFFYSNEIGSFWNLKQFSIEVKKKEKNKNNI